jgi:hypothetical protein
VRFAAAAVIRFSNRPLVGARSSMTRDIVIDRRRWVVVNESERTDLQSNASDCLQLQANYRSGSFAFAIRRQRATHHTFSRANPYVN